jgi:hypothetical protein
MTAAFDLIIRGGQIADGTGAEPVPGDVAWSAALRSPGSGFPASGSVAVISAAFMISAPSPC